MIKVSGIYIITCRPEGMLPYYYVGQSVNVHSRLSHHRASLRGGRHHNNYLQKLWRKHGESTFLFEILETGIVDELDEMEEWWLSEMVGYQRVCNFSLCTTAPMRGVKFSEEHRRKLGDCKRGDAHWTKRIGVSQEFREKMSLIQKGRELSDEVKRRMSDAQRKRYKAKPKERGAAHASAKPVIGFNPQTGETVRFACIIDAKEHGFAPTKISSCCNGNRPHHRGFVWCFDEAKEQG